MRKDLLSRTEYILKEARASFKKVGTLWSGGKDSTALLHIISKTFPDFPFAAIHLDNGKEFRETYDYMDTIKSELSVPLIKEPIEIKFDSITGLVCCGHNKTEALKRVIVREKFDAIIVAIRWDEHGIRGLERYFSPRDREFRWNVYNPNAGQYGEALQDAEFISWGIAVSDFGEKCDHVRIHPLLHWTELNVWEYIKENRIPINPLYFSRQGKRFRSIGCTECSIPVESEARNIEEIVAELEITKTPEREGRVQDKETAMERLRALGYM
jgi:sulfate adenylyltransferase subunit 2